MNPVIIREENMEDIEFQWMPVVSEETVSTPNGEKSQDLPKSQKSEIIENNTHIPSTSCIDSESGKKNLASKKKRKDKKAKDRVTQPLNAFMLYLKEKRAEFVANSSIYKYSSELNKLVGKLWHSLTDEQRAAYYAQAREERRRHALLHPRKESTRRPPRKKTCLPDGVEFRNCRAKYGMDSKNLWCANCRRKKKCFWFLKALAEENGGVLPKLPLQEPPKDSSEKNDSSSTISKTEFDAVFEEAVSTPNGVKSPVLLKSQKSEIIENNTHIPSASFIDRENGKKNIASKKKQKPKKAKDRVKRPLNAFMLYLKEKRAEFVANSTINKYTSLELNKVVAKLWHSLADEQRAAYDAQAREEWRRHALLHPRKESTRRLPRKRTCLPDGVEFRNCRAKYGMDSKNLWCANCRSQRGEIIENNTHIPSVSCIDSESGKKNIASKKKQKTQKAKDRLKRPLNAFMLYLKEKRAEFVANSTIYKYSTELNKVVGKLWHSLTDEQRAAYYAQAREERRRHALLHPLAEYTRRPPRKWTCRPDRLEFRKCRAKFGLDSKHLWCANCRRKKKCHWVLKALTDENGGVSPKLPPRCKKPSKVSCKKKKDSSSTISKTGLKFKNCRAKFGMDSKNLWCANCRRKKKCLWLLKALAEENGGVLPKLPQRRKKPPKDSREKNDSSSTINKTDINLEKCRQKDNTDLENQKSKPRTRRKAPADREYNIYVRQLEKMAQSSFVFDGQNEFAKFCLELNAKYDDAKSCLEMNAKEDDAKSSLEMNAKEDDANSSLEMNAKEDDANSSLEMNAKEDDAKSCLEMNAKQGDAMSCFEKNVRQHTELYDNGKEIQIEPYEMKNEIEDLVPHTVKLEIFECEETKIGGISSQAAAVEMMKVKNIKEENIEL